LRSTRRNKEMVGNFGPQRGRCKISAVLESEGDLIL
jgi:hypothetical protein